MLSRPLTMLSGVFLLFAFAYVAAFNAAVRVSPAAAESRFDILRGDNRPRAAAVYGERVLNLQRKAGVGDEALAPLKAELAETLVAARRYRAGASLYEEALSSDWAGSLGEIDRAAREDHLARAHIAGGDIAKAVRIYGGFLALSGDAESRDGDSLENVRQDFYAGAIDNAARLFADALKPMGERDAAPTDSPEAALLAARHMTELGAFYALKERHLHAAAGLLSSAYLTRRDILGGDHTDTVQIALMLGPVYRQLGRLQDAEDLYLEAFHAQEKSKGPNSPDLSLYIKLLASIYEEQGRATEAQALYEHMRVLFQDAFGAQRYAANRRRDRTLDVDRPVSQFFLLDDGYSPNDLVPAAEFSVPLSKNSGLDEMKIRLAADRRRGADPREENLPARLAQLISLCRAETGERLSLRSGYRSFHTQDVLFDRFAHKGTVTPPGMSEHQLGLAADIDVNGRLMRQSDKSYRCFEENAFRFGFILSYPPGNDYLPSEDSFEPWHWRYVGVKTAQLYREAGPVNRPQEFLAALECYEERAASGAFPIAGEGDVCLDRIAADDKRDASPGLVAGAAPGAPALKAVAEGEQQGKTVNAAVGPSGR